MAVNVLINGMGELGRRLFRMIFDKELSGSLATDLTVTMINDSVITDLNQLARLLQYDTVYGRWKGYNINVDTTTNELTVYNDTVIQTVKVYSETNVANLPLGAKSISLSIDCTGRVTAAILQSYKDNGSQVAIGVRNASGTTPPCIVSGINDQGRSATNGMAYSPYGNAIALAQILGIIAEKYGVSSALTDEITAYTNLNNLEDNAYPAYTDTSQIGRAGAWNIIPSHNNAPKILGAIIPALNGKANGDTREVAVITGAVMDCFVQTVKPVESADAIGVAIKTWLEVDHKDWQMEYADVGFVSSDMIGLPRTCFDAKTCVGVLAPNYIRVSVIYDPITVAAANAVLIGDYIYAKA